MFLPSFLSLLLLVNLLDCIAFSPSHQLHTSSIKTRRVRFATKSDGCDGDVYVDDIVLGLDVDVDGIDSTRRAAVITALGFVTAGVASSPSPASAAATTATEAEAFVGKYSDPINHPGGTRDIKLVNGATVGDYTLAQVFGGGGRGEPKGGRSSAHLMHVLFAMPHITLCHFLTLVSFILSFTTKRVCSSCSGGRG